MTSADDARLVADLAAAGTKRALAIENTRELADLLTLPAYARMPSELRTFPDLIQGTDEWHEQRRGMITASLIGNLITTKTLAVANNDTSRGLIAQLAAERITGRTDPNYVNDDMLRGIEDEPRAVDVYSKHFAPVTPDGFLVRSWGRFELGYSADGLVGEDGLIEVKSRRAKAQVLTVVSGEVPAANMAQLMAGLFVSGRDWIDYVSYSGGMHMWVTRVYPDPKWFEAIAAAVEAFEDSVTDVINKYNAGTVGMPMTERIELEMTI
jgi:hypothetical protein